MAREPKHLGGWFLRWVAGAPRRWLGRDSTVGQDLTGTSHGLSYLRHLARGNKVPLRSELETVEEQPPVLVVHGFLGTRGSMYALEKSLIDQGFTVFSFNLGTFNVRDIRRSAFLIHRKIESILAQTGVDKVDFVGHSMGGLIGLYYVKKLGGRDRVRRLIMMGSPVRGTWVALAGVFTIGLWSSSTWQLLPRSRFLDELAQGPIPPGIKIYSIAAARDWVCPPRSTKLRGATHISVPLGHSSLVVSPSVFERIFDLLRAPDAVADAIAGSQVSG